MQLDELNPDIYILYSIKSDFSCQRIEKTSKTRGSEKLTFLEKTAYGSFIKFAVFLNDLFFLIRMIN
jgi:hypothetical protein